MRQWCAGTINLAGPFNMQLIHQLDEAVYVRRLNVLFCRYRSESTEEQGLNWLSQFCFEPPYDEIYLVCDELEW